MNAPELSCAIDALATRDPEHCGYGYADSQYPWHHDPAIDHPRTTFHEFVQYVQATTPRATVVLIGLGRRGTIHRAMRLVADRVISIDAEPQHAVALGAQGGFDPSRDFVITEDPVSERAQRAVQDVAATVDALLIDLDSGYETARRAWQRHARHVRAGGIVAIVDRSQVDPETPGLGGVDQFVTDLERDFLMPRGVTLRRLGDAHAIFAYVQTASCQAGDAVLTGFEPRQTAARHEILGECLGFVLHRWQGGCLAVRGSGCGFHPRALVRNEYEVVLATSDAASAATAVEAWTAAAPVLDTARRALADNDVAQARRLVAQVVQTHAGLRETWMASLEQAPWNKALLQALGTLTALDGRPREGVALLRRALGTEMIDGEALRTVAAAYLHLRRDEPLSRELLREAKAAVRRRRIAQVCHGQLRGHVLWHYPKLIADVRGVLHVGAHRGELVPAWAALEIPTQCYIEPRAESFAALERACRERGAGQIRCLQHAVGERDHAATLRWGSDMARASLRRTHALAGRGTPVQTNSCEFAVTTLDALVASGQIDPRQYDLLFLDTEGTELEVLRGARDLLRHIDVISVRVFLQPVYDGTALPEQIQAFLREVFGKDGFVLRAFEPGDDPSRGEAVFRRIKARRARP